MQYTSRRLYIEDNDLVISLREREVKVLRPRYQSVNDIPIVGKRDLYEEEEQDRHAFDDQGEDSSNMYTIYLPRDKQKASSKRIKSYYSKIDDWDIPLRYKNNAKRLLHKLEAIINHGFYVILRPNLLMDCYINIGKGLLLTISKSLLSNYSKVPFALTYKEQVIRINTEEIDILINQIIQLQQKLHFI